MITNTLPRCYESQWIFSEIWDLERSKSLKVIVIFELSQSLVYVSQPMSGQFANLQSVIFQSFISAVASFNSVIVQSCSFHPCDFGRHFPVLRCPVLQLNNRQTTSAYHDDGGGAHRSGCVTELREGTVAWRSYCETLSIQVWCETIIFNCIVFVKTVMYLL